MALPVRGKIKQDVYGPQTSRRRRPSWKHLQPPATLLNEGASKPLPAAVTVGAVIARHEAEYIPGLAKSTRNTDGSMLRVHITPKWSETLVADVHADEVDAWLRSLPLEPPSKGRARRMMKQLIDKAMFWRLIPVGINPITLVKVKGSTKRVKKIELLTGRQVVSLVAALPQPYNLMVLVAASLGPRVEEVVALKWEDFDFKQRTVTIRRAYTHSELKEVKTDASAATLPITASLIAALKAYRTGDSEWVFPLPRTGGPYSSDTILAKQIKPAAERLGLPKIGWHTFRHSYRSWIGGEAATLSQQKDMMRHADIATTANVYGGTPVEEMRPSIEVLSRQLQPKRPRRKC